MRLIRFKGKLIKLDYMKLVLLLSSSSHHSLERVTTLDILSQKERHLSKKVSFL